MNVKLIFSSSVASTENVPRAAFAPRAVLAAFNMSTRSCVETEPAVLSPTVAVTVVSSATTVNVDPFSAVVGVDVPNAVL